MGRIIVHKENNDTINDNMFKGKLSWDACCLLAKVISESDNITVDWNVFEHKHNVSKQKRIKALKELIQEGYAYIDKRRKGSAWTYDFWFFEKPQSHDMIEEMLNCEVA